MECVSLAWKPIPEVVVLALEMTFGPFFFLEDFPIKTQTPLTGYILLTSYFWVYEYVICAF